ncbi:M14 family zinc carboxypeptidase [Dyadobacter sp. NIV53]|uniref:M14 family zinc carboxypeptidase n=1 Tax=Dyadobacter sp. NIV53 TaxID=2861765 RepID=UPI001C86A30E|nr:M14 family zinc carboxypeptidase [Dyadobacter sp. NIV53]
MIQPSELASRLFDSHQNYLETVIAKRRFKQKDMLPLIEKRKENPLYQVQSVGESFEGRNIQLLKTGNGKRKVLLWTQMHGDEATATMATFDIFNFLEGKNDGFDDFRKELFTNTTLYFVPMLNPDGAERYQRRNAQEIDINRDALALQAPESRILKQLQQNIQPEFGFNLHDKNPRYSVGNTSKLATISFLATAYDQEKSINTVREKSMQVISVMNKAMQKFIPGQVGKWNEDFEPRAFGDNIQKWGTTLILIESGGYAGDPEKQFIRKLNFVAILTGLASIADNLFAKEGIAEYQALLENNRYIYDLLVKNVTVIRDGKKYQADLGINRYEINQDDASSFSYKSIIEDYGDLSIFSGTEELDATGLELEHEDISRSLALDDVATFTLRKNNKSVYAVVNGFVSDLRN